VSRVRRKLTFANVCSLLALLIALGTGSAYAANTIFSSDIADGEVKTADLAINSVRSTKIATGQVQSTDVKDGSLTGDDVDESKLGLGVPWTEVTNGSTGFCNADSTHPVSWTTPFSQGNATLAYQRDAAGYVHLRGTAKCPLVNDFPVWPAGSLSVVFFLPPGFRPAAPTYSSGLARITDAPKLAPVLILDGGAVSEYSNTDTRTSISLDGITFRCGPSGQDGCP
jgi:hypothetical protein